MPETVRDILAEVRRLLLDAELRLPRLRLCERLLTNAVEQLVEDVERQEARIKELENWRTS